MKRNWLVGHKKFYPILLLVPLNFPSRSPSPTTSPENPAFRKFRFWSVFAAAFARTFSYAIYNLALPNYLIYFRHISPDILGYIISANQIAFIIGPLFGFAVTKRIGIRNTVILASVGSVVFVGLQLVSFEAWSLILLRAADGFITGFFWPQLQMEVSNWQRVDPGATSGQYFDKYAMSWNIGILLGELLGYVIVFSGQGNELVALIISWTLMIAMVPCAVAMEKPSTQLSFRGTEGIVFLGTTGDGQVIPVEVQSAPKLSEKPKPELEPSQFEEPHSNRSLLLAFPALFYLLGTMIYQFLNSFYPFMYPLALSVAGIPSYYVYLITFIHQFVQILIVIRWTRKGVKAGYNGWVAGMVLNIAFLGILWAFPDVWLLTLAFIVGGACLGWLYNFTAKIMQEYGAAKKSLKYATFYEFCNGIGSGIAPMLAGIVATYGTLRLATNYPVTLFIVLGYFLVLFLLGWKGRKLLQKEE